jgi:hypothetical protein
MKIELNGKFIIISILVLIGLFFLLWRGCGGNNAAVAKANALADSAIKANEVKDKAFASLQATLTDLRRDSAQQRINAEALAEEANNALTAQADAEDNTKKYQNKYELARKQLDTALSLVVCDSLTLAISRERIKANAAQKACKDQVNGLGDILSNKNKEIGVLTRQVQALRQPTNIVNDALHAVKAATKEPWVKGYIGAEGDMGVTFGGGPSVAFEFRNGLLLTGAVKLMGGTTVYEAGVHKLISFKKR